MLGKLWGSLNWNSGLKYTRSPGGYMYDEQGLAQGRVSSGLFEIDLNSGELHKSGRKVALQEQPFRVLAMLLERPGEVVTRQDLQARMWPTDTYVGFEEGLNTAIRKLRQAFGDSADNPRFIETVPRRGYRFIAPASNKTKGEATLPLPPAPTQTALVVEPPLAQGRLEQSGKEGSSERDWPTKRLKLRHALLIATASLLLAWFLRPSLPPPRVVRVRQLTRLGDLEYKIVTDGPRIFFGKGNWGMNDHIYWQSIEGGESALIGQIPSASEVQSVSPNGSELLVRTGVGNVRALWKVTLPSGSPQPLGGVRASDAVWSPDGETIAFTADAGLYAVKNDGSQVRKVATFPGYARRPVWSLDGRRIRVTVSAFGGGVWSLRERTMMEVDVATGATHPVVLGSRRGSSAGPSRAWPQSVGWIRNGDYFLFTAYEEGVNNIWAVRERGSWLRRPSQEPVRLTAGPLNFPFPIPSPDGKAIFAVGEQYRAELMRYD